MFALQAEARLVRKGDHLRRIDSTAPVARRRKSKIGIRITGLPEVVANHPL